ncbi:MAG: hypothetical protein M3Y22_10865 [Pseudomonadota bacterium]|nr:hypothetical protein [Pseudomonadota bacterium]
MTIPANRGRAWTPDDDDDLRRRIDARQTASVIAKAIGRTQDAIRGRAAVLGLTLPSPTRPWRIWVPHKPRDEQ